MEQEKANDRILNFVLWTGTILSGLTLLIITVITAVNVRESQECRKWFYDAQKYPEYYIAQWQADQCAAHQIFISAPIK